MHPYICHYYLDCHVKRFFIRFFILCSLMSMSYLCNAQTLRLVVPQFPPYTNEVKGNFEGIGIEMIKSLMQNMNIDYQLRSVPNYARAEEELASGRADGFFLASENHQRNQIAIFSTPLMENKWSWFLAADNSIDPSSASFRKEAKVASLRGSNTSRWLKENGYNIVNLSNNAEYFPKLLLDLKRINAVFLSENVFQDELQKQGYSESNYIKIVQSSKDFGIYISKAYASQHPQFMTQLNQAIKKQRK